MIILILVISLVLRLITLNQSLWFDESVSALSAKNLSFWHFVTGYPIGDFHPPGYFALLWIWERLFGISEIAVRMPSVILGVATVCLIYLIGQQIFNRKVGLMAALFLAVSPLHVYYSQEARMYSLATFAVALSFFALLKILNNQKKYWSLFVVSTLLILLSDYVAYLAIPTQFLYVLIYERKKIKEIFGWQILAGIIFSPWLSIFPAQLINGRITAQNVPGWAAVVGGFSFKAIALVYVKGVIGRISIANKIIYVAVLLPIGIFYSGVIFYGVRKISKEVSLLIFWAFVPAILALMLSFFIPVLSYFRMLFVIPGFCLLVAYSISKFNQKWQYFLVATVIIISSVSLFFYYTNPAFQRENWKGLEQYFENSSGGNLVLFENNDIPAPFEYYLLNVNPKNTYLGGLATFPASTTKDVINLESLLPNYQHIYLVDYLVGISDPNRVIDKSLTNMGYHVTRAIDFPSLGLVYEYQK